MMADKDTSNKHIYACVRLLDAPYHIDREYTYYIPRDMADEISPGVFVTVPFGGGNRKKTAIVTSTSDETDVTGVKPILSITNRAAALTPDLLGLCSFLSQQTLSTYGEAVRTVVPSAALSKIREFYTVTDKEPNENKSNSLSTKALYVYSFIKAHGRVSDAKLRSEFGDATATAELTSALVRHGYIKRELDVCESTNVMYDVDVALAVTADEAREIASGGVGAKVKLRSKRAREILAYLADAGEGAFITEDMLEDALGPVGAQLKMLADANLVTLTKRERWRNPYADIKCVEHSPVILSNTQKRAFNTILSLYKSGEAKAALLHGVTGSGKTQVIISMIDEVIADGRGVIILVPEIALTPQTVSIYCSRYGQRVAVIHSSLSAGERADAWRRVRAGEADIVVGTRSAVFAPIANLGMIVIDEEQEHTYKSDMPPKYSAHDVARYRCATSNALMLLSSATPSLQSYHKAVGGTYTLVTLSERYGDAVLPEVTVVDMRREKAAGATSPISSHLASALAETISRGEQAILFLNRRGYNIFLSCRSCGEAVQCPRCSVALTYHVHRRLADTSTPEEYRAEHGAAGRLVCHYCGYTVQVPEKCPSCGGENLYYMGYGTQRIEQELVELVPGARILRMDADTTRTKSAYDNLIGAFKRHEADILLGTQMVTKGHDFPLVTLVGVLLAESSLYLDDYRAGERTFSLITQVIGRAGRSSLPGRAIIQTYTPENENLRLACAQDYEAFYKSEIELRRRYVFPPFCDIAQITLTSEDEAALAAATVRLDKYIRASCEGEYKDVSIVMFGPFEAPIYRINGKYRMRVVIKCKLSRRTRQFFDDILRGYGSKLGRSVTVSLDFNPNTI